MLLKSELHGSQTETCPTGSKQDTYSFQFDKCMYLEWFCTALLDPILNEAKNLVLPDGLASIYDKYLTGDEKGGIVTKP